MITLQDYIGKIYKDITNAKVQSDIETLAIADEYVNNPLLKHFSVPNIRIKNIELNIPVAIEDTQAIVRDYTAKEIQDVYYNSFESAFLSFRPAKADFVESIRVDLLKKAEAVANDAAPQLKQARYEDEQQAQSAETANDGTYEAGAKYTFTLEKIAINFAEATYSFVDGDIPQEEFYPVLTSRIETALVPKQPKIETLPVIVETNRLKLIDDPASLVNIKVTITDDAMEWTTDVDADGNPVQVLTYE